MKVIIEAIIIEAIIILPVEAAGFVFALHIAPLPVLQLSAFQYSIDRLPDKKTITPEIRSMPCGTILVGTPARMPPILLN